MVAREKESPFQGKTNFGGATFPEGITMKRGKGQERGRARERKEQAGQILTAQVSKNRNITLVRQKTRPR